jgi:tetratricopeptide (TPR) repeat protein
MYALAGSSYCDLLLDLGRFDEVRQRAAYALNLAQQYVGQGLRLYDIAHDHVSLGRAALALGDLVEAKAHLDPAVDGLRKAGRIDYLPRGLLARAAFFLETGDRESARRDLDEAIRIARRSEMRLFQCDAYLGYARLALAEGERERARGHVAEAKRLVEETGYGRRRPEVEELETQLFD